MWFGRCHIDEAEAAILAHSIRAGSVALKKGRVLSAEDLADLRRVGILDVVVARLEADDVAEDQAADALAQVLSGTGVHATTAFTGRANLFADAHGIALVDVDRVARLNQVDEALTLASVAPYEVVTPGRILGTVKVIPFAAPRDAVERCRRIAGDGGSPLRVAAFRPCNVGVVLTRLPGSKDGVLEKTVDGLRKRLHRLGSRLAFETVCGHHEAEISAAVSDLAAQGADPILIFGASAIVDRRDVVPAGIELAGGTIRHFGLPVDPGNLLLLARLGDVNVVGVPGCARSIKLNGFDWVLQRLLAGLDITRKDIAAMGAGGLLKEIGSRPQPRESHADIEPPRLPRIGVVVLAAGMSRRMGATNKLLEEIDGVPMVVRAVDAALATRNRPVVVVTGHQRDQVEATLADRPVEFAHNPAYADGLSSSLRAGLGALPDGLDGALVCLGDMPRLGPAHIERLVDAYNPVEGRSICVPTRNGKRGNPVLWDAKFFAEMREVAGDVGARHLIGAYADEVCEVEIDDEAIFVDIDTPAALTAARQKGVTS